MKIFVKTIDGTTYIIDIDPNSDISLLKGKVYDIAGIYPSVQRLIFAGKLLIDSMNFRDYNIATDSTIHLILRFPGG